MANPRSRLSLQERMNRIDGKVSKDKQPAKPWIIATWVVFALMWVVPGLVPAVGMMLGGSALSVKLLLIPKRSAKVNGAILLVLFLGMLALNIYVLSK